MNCLLRPALAGVTWGVFASFALADDTLPESTAVPEPVAAASRVVAPVSVPALRPAIGADARAYRQHAARHIYSLNGERVYKGRMPPLLHAVAVLEVEVEASGELRRLAWMRAPRHAPEVMAEIERMVKAAAPFPPHESGGAMRYVDTWLWHKSGRFQLDTLTEGQD